MKYFVWALRHGFVLLGLGAAVAACSSDPKTAAEKPLATAPVAARPEPAPATAPAPAPAPASADSAVPAGFDAAAAPVVSPKLGAFPFFSLLDGYQKMTPENEPGNSAKEYLRDVAFDRYEFFDGVKLIPVEGRLYTVRAMGKGASFFQVQKTYEKLVKDLGGVTVFEGKGKQMSERKLAFDEKRHRAYNLDYDKMGVYMVRMPDREVWVETYKTWNDSDNDNYWLTVVERRALPVQASVLPAAQLKKELDANGHVALYLNFDTDKATLRPDAAPVVEQVVKLLQTTPGLRLAVEGHTDNAGTATRNQQLSEQRAQAVVAALTAQRIAPDRLRAAGFGQSKPLADNATEEGKAKNRRVELVRL